MDLNKLKSLVEEKDVVIEQNDDVIRVNHEIGNDKTWVEFDVNGRTEEQMAALINVHVSKMKTGKINDF